MKSNNALQTNSGEALRLAAAYIRVSTDDQVELSPDSQLAEIRKWASSHGYLVPDEYVFRDEGISGRKVTGRDQFKRMIGTAKKKPKPFDAILLWKYSRFARNRDDAVMYKSILRKQLGIEVLSISEPMADGKMGIITEALIEAMDEYYSLNLAEEVRRGMEEAAKRGKLQATPAYGYTVKEHVLTPIEPEATHVKEIFRRFNAGEGTYPLARWLNSMGARTHRGSEFENRTVEYILRNPVYIGKLRWNPTGRTRRDFNNENIIIADGGHEPLITQEEFDAAQKRIAELKALHKYKGKPAEVQRDWLTGLVRCASCGATLIFAKPHYWKCNNYVRGRCRHSQHIKDDLLRDAIMRRLQIDMDREDLAFDVIRATDNGQAELDALKTARAAAAKKIDRLREAFLAGADTIEEYREAKQVYARQVEELDAKIEQFNFASKALAASKSIRSEIRDTIQTLVSDESMDKKYISAHSLVEYATFDKEQNLLQVHYRFIL